VAISGETLHAAERNKGNSLEHVYARQGLMSQKYADSLGTFPSVNRTRYALRNWKIQHGKAKSHRQNMYILIQIGESNDNKQSRGNKIEQSAVETTSSVQQKRRLRLSSRTSPNVRREGGRGREAMISNA